MQGIRSDQDQQSVLTWLQAERTVGRSAARRLVTRGVWQSPFPRVPVTHSGTLSPPERAIAALLSCPPGSVLGGWSALAFDGMTDLWTRPPWALVKTGAHKPCRDGVRILHSAALGPADVHPYRSPVRTRSARSLVDPAGATDTAAAARLLLIRGYQHGFTTTALLDQVLRTRGQCRQLGLLRETVLDLEGGIRSLPEREFARPVLPGCRLAGVRMAAEVHGRHHLAVRTQENDWLRHNVLTIGGRRVLHVTSYAVRAAHGDRSARRGLVRLLPLTHCHPATHPPESISRRPTRTTRP